MILLYVWAGMAVTLLPNYLKFFCCRAVLKRDYPMQVLVAFVVAALWPLHVRAAVGARVVNRRG